MPAVRNTWFRSARRRYSYAWSPEKLLCTALKPTWYPSPQGPPNGAPKLMPSWIPKSRVRPPPRLPAPTPPPAGALGGALAATLAAAWTTDVGAIAATRVEGTHFSRYGASRIIRGVRGQRV